MYCAFSTKKSVFVSFEQLFQPRDQLFTQPVGRDHPDRASRRQQHAEKQVRIPEFAKADLASTDKDGYDLGGLGVVAFIRELGLVPSNREGFMTIEQGGLKIAGEKITDKKLLITEDTFAAADGKLLVEKGKKKKLVVKLK